jgi:hypothetical protein
MVDVAVFHVLGLADLALSRGQDPKDALQELRHDPDRILNGTPTHPGNPLGPLPSTINQLNELGYRVIEVVLFATDQEPSHPLDTRSWLPVLTPAFAHLSSLNNDHEITFSTQIIPELSISSLATAGRTAVSSQGGQIVIPIAGGAKAGFLGLLIGTTAAGYNPLLLPVNREGARGSLRSVADIDSLRWLIRRRMWAAVATNLRVNQEVRDLASDLDAFEREAPSRTRPDLPSDHIAPMWSRTISEWAAQEPTWVTNISRIVDELTCRAVDQLPARDRRKLSDQVNKWKRENPDVVGRTDSDVCVRVAAQRPRMWADWKDGPESLKNWLVRYASVEQARTARHGRYPKYPFPREGTTAAHQLVLDVAQGNLLKINPPLGDPVLQSVFTKQLPAVPDSPATPVRLSLRLAGQRNAPNPQIAETIEQHHRSLSPEQGPFLPVLVLASDGTAQHEDLVIEAHDPEASVADALRVLRNYCDDIETRKKVRIRKISLYLNQGTQIMNLAALTAVVSVAAELGADLELFDVAISPTNDTKVTALPTPDVVNLVRESMPETEIRSLLLSCIETLHLAQALSIVTLLNDPDLTRRVQYLSNLTLRPLNDVPRSDLSQRLRGIAPGVALVISLSSMLGERDVVGRLSVMLSAAVASDKEDKWDQVPQLRDLWNARNALFHRRRDFVFPESLDLNLLESVAKHFKVTFSPNEPANGAAIELRAGLLRDLQASIVRGDHL